jgi:hypothetical protein
VTLPHEWLEQARADIDEAVSGSHELSDALRPQYTKRLNTLERQENYFLDLAAEEGWPKDKLRAKIYAIRTERKDIDNTLSQSEQRINQGRDIFYAALTLLQEPQHAYERGNETVRSILHKAFFVRLCIDDGKVIDHDAQEPFGALSEVDRSTSWATPGRVPYSARRSLRYTPAARPRQSAAPNLCERRPRSSRPPRVSLE